MNSKQSQEAHSIANSTSYITRLGAIPFSHSVMGQLLVRSVIDNTIIPTCYNLRMRWFRGCSIVCLIHLLWYALQWSVYCFIIIRRPRTKNGEKRTCRIRSRYRFSGTSSDRHWGLKPLTTRTIIFTNNFRMKNFAGFTRWGRRPWWFETRNS